MSEATVLSDSAIMQMVVGGLSDASRSGSRWKRAKRSARRSKSSWNSSPTCRGSRPMHSSTGPPWSRSSAMPPPRYFHGAAGRLTALGPDERENWHYAIDIVPQI